LIGGFVAGRRPNEDSGDQVCHVIAGFLRDLTPLLGKLTTISRDFH